jgi:hypothetical protein
VYTQKLKILWPTKRGHSPVILLDTLSGDMTWSTVVSADVRQRRYHLKKGEAIWVSYQTLEFLKHMRVVRQNVNRKKSFRAAVDRRRPSQVYRPPAVNNPNIN